MTSVIRDSEKFEIFFKTLQGKIYTLEVHLKQTLFELKQQIYDKINVPIEQQRLVYAGKQLEDENTLVDYSIQKESTIHMVLRLCGMISDFKSLTDTENKYLMKSDSEEIPSKELLSKVQKSCGASNDLMFEFKKTGDAILSLSQRLILMKLTDIIHQINRMKDMKILFQFEKYAFSKLFDLDQESSNKIHKKLIELHSNYDNAKIVLRRTQGPIDGCINFHCDGSYATKTAQLTLNDDTEYEGGRLCFYTRDTFFQPRRPAATLTIHHRQILHGVTRLTSGCRKSLFVVDKLNGLGDTGIFYLNNKIIDKIYDIIKSNSTETFMVEPTNPEIPDIRWNAEQVQNWLKTTINIQEDNIIRNLRNTNGMQLFLMGEQDFRMHGISAEQTAKIIQIIHQN